MRPVTPGPAITSTYPGESMTRKPLDIVFMGNPDFSVPSLQQLHQSRHNVVAVVTGSDKRRGRGGALSPSPVKSAASALSLHVIEADNMRDPALHRQLAALAPDLLVVVAYKLLPPEMLAIPKTGSLNLHASLLPKYRGAAPIHWALINGETETGCTVFLLDEGMDTGMILGQEKTAVGQLETTGDLYDRLKVMGAGLLVRTVDRIADGTHAVQPQENARATRAPKIQPEDARIDFQGDMVQVHNFIRGMSPFPGAWTLHEGRKLKIYRTEPAPGGELSPGEAAVIDGRGRAGCRNGCVILAEVQPQGKKRMSGTDFLNGLGGHTFFSS
jgi:methionyl-tRNA formyltransferase